MCEKGSGIDKTRLALAIYALDQFTGEAWSGMDADSRAEAICNVYSLTKDKTSVIDLLDALRGIK